MPWVDDKYVPFVPGGWEGPEYRDLITTYDGGVFAIWKCGNCRSNSTIVRVKASVLQGKATHHDTEFALYGVMRQHYIAWHPQSTRPKVDVEYKGIVVFRTEQTILAEVRENIFTLIVEEVNIDKADGINIIGPPSPKKKVVKKRKQVTIADEPEDGQVPTAQQAEKKVKKRRRTSFEGHVPDFTPIEPDPEAQNEPFFPETGLSIKSAAAAQLLATCEVMKNSVREAEKFRDQIEKGLGRRVMQRAKHTIGAATGFPLAAREDVQITSATPKMDVNGVYEGVEFAAKHISEYGTPLADFTFIIDPADGLAMRLEVNREVAKSVVDGFVKAASGPGQELNGLTNADLDILVRNLGIGDIGTASVMPVTTPSLIKPSRKPTVIRGNTIINNGPPPVGRSGMISAHKKSDIEAMSNKAIAEWRNDMAEKQRRTNEEMMRQRAMMEEGRERWRHRR